MDPLETLESTRRKSGHRAVDFIVSGSAIVIAVISLVVALRQSVIMKEQLAASVWPYLQYDTSNTDDEGRSVIQLDVRNAGVGPARVRSVALKFEGKPILQMRDWLDTCCADLVQKQKPSWATSRLDAAVLTPGQIIHFFALRPSADNPEWWARLNTERFKLEARICYCSVLDECWMLDSTKREREPMASCPAPQDTDYRN